MRKLLLCLPLLVLIAPIAAACTGVVIARDGEVLVGGNEDWERLDSYMWATAPTSQAHGVVYFGYEIRGEWGNRPPYWQEFQGINDQGLYFDSFSAPCVASMRTLNKPWRSRLWTRVMATCSTTAEAVALFQSCDLSFMECEQFLFVDRLGNAAVVECNQTVWMQGNTFAVTNFHLSNPSLGDWPCWRYDRVMALLKIDATPSLDRVGELLKAASQPGTRYSVICDLVRGVARVVYDHDFSRWATLDLDQLWQQGSPRVPLKSLVDAAG